MTHIIALPWPKPPLTGNDRGHTRYRPVAAALDAARIAVRKAKPPHMAAAHVTLHWRIPTNHRRDADNLAPTYKVCQDALVLEWSLSVAPTSCWGHRVTERT